MYSFWDSIDTTENIKRALYAIRGIRGLAALVLIVPMILMVLALAALSYHFDIHSTMVWTEKSVSQVAASTPSRLVSMIGYIVVALTVLPTLVELFLGKFAIHGIRFAQVLVFGMALFDMITDWPAVVAFFDGYKEVFDQLGILSVPAFYLIRLVWLFLASFGFESLTIVLSVVVLALFANMKSIPQGVHHG